MISAHLREEWASAYLSVVISSLLLAGCATDTQTTQAQGAGAGALLGALIGAAVGRDARGALIGGAVGSVAGLAVGDQVAQKKAQYAKREDILRGSAERARQLAQQTRQQNEQLTNDVARLDLAVQSLRKQEMSAEARQALIQSNEHRVAVLLNGIDLQLQQVRREISRQQSVLAAEAQQAEQTKQASPQEGVRLVNAGIRDLESGQRVLEEAKAQLLLIDPRRAY